MKLKELENVLRSERGYMQFAIVYDINENADIETDCAIGYAVANYGERELVRIQAVDNKIVLTIK